MRLKADLTLLLVSIVWGSALVVQRLASIQIVGCMLILAAVLLSQIKKWNSGKIDHEHLVEGR